MQMYFVQFNIVKSGTMAVVASSKEEAEAQVRQELSSEDGRIECQAQEFKKEEAK